MKSPTRVTEPSKFTQAKKRIFGVSMMVNAMAMKMYASLLLALLVALLLPLTAAAAEKIRIILDTDAMAEVDDQHALAYALFSGDHFEVEGITVNRGSDYPERTERRPYFGTVTIDDHFREAVNVARMCASPDVPVLKGPAVNYRQIKGDINNSTFDGSDAVNFIIEQAHAPSDRPLHIYAMGNLTNVALALLKDPTIAAKIEIWWLGTEWPQNYACNNHAGDLDAVDALLANSQNVTFNIIPWPHKGVTFAEIKDRMTGRGPQVSPALPGLRGEGPDFASFGDYSVHLFDKFVGSRQKENGRSLLDMVGLAAVKNNVGEFTPYEMGAPSFAVEEESQTGSQAHRYPGTWVENADNPRRVTMWRNPNRDAVYNDFFNTMDNYVLAGSTSHAQEVSQIHHREHNILLDATISGNMHSFDMGLRGDGPPAQREEHSHNYIVYDFKKQSFLDFRGTSTQVSKTLVSKTDYYEYGVSKGADLGVVTEDQAAYWMAEWEAPVSVNFITLTGSNPEEPSQVNTAWKIELRSGGTWLVHDQGVGGWYDRGEYFWGGRDQSPIQFDALRVKLYSKDGSSTLSNIHFRAQENKTWMVAYLPPVDAQIAVTQQVPRAGQAVEFAGNQVFGAVESWQWEFGDDRTATGQTVSHTFANPGTYDVTLTLSGAGQTVNIVDRVTIHPAVEAQITPLSGSVLQGNPVTFDASNSYGSIGTYHWDFGDGSTATGKQVTKKFSKAGINRVTLTVSNSTGSNSCSALVRVNTPATVNVPKVLLDTDVEIDDIYFVAYGLYSELDVLGINTVHHGGEDPAQEPGNHKRLLNLLDLASQSGLPDARVPMAFRGAAGPLIPPYRDNWPDTKPVVTEASDAILEAARGASPDNPVWLVPVGPLTNVANAILQVRREGWESEFHKRIRICWLGGSPSGTRIDTWNGKRDPWAAYIVAQSGIEFLLMLEPVGIQLRWDKRDERSRYPETPFGEYLYNIGWNRYGGYYDPTALAAVISIHADQDWFGDLQKATLLDRYQDYRWETTTAPTNIRLIHNIDADAIKNDWFNTLNGKPTDLSPKQ